MNGTERKAHPGQDWLLCAAIELPARPGNHGQIEAWLAAELNRLEATDDLAGKILASAGAVVAAAQEEARPIHLCLFTSAARLAPGQTWGFFRIERNEGKHSAAETGAVQAVAFYLYVEGPPKPAPTRAADPSPDR